MSQFNSETKTTRRYKRPAVEKKQIVEETYLAGNSVSYVARQHGIYSMQIKGWRMNIVFLFYDGMTALDAIGPQEVLCRLPSALIKRVAIQAGPVTTESGGLTLIAEYSIEDVDSADVLVIPGAGNATSLKEHPKIMAWIRTLHANSQYTTAVCTGSLILGAAGVLQGHRATSHWAAIDRLTGWGAHPIEQRIVESGKVITAAGVSAGIDMALYLAAKLAGDKLAKSIQLGIEYDPEPPFDVGSPAKAGSDIVNALRDRLTRQFEKP